MQLDPSACKVRYNGQPFHLSSKEYSLLELFLRHQERIFSQGTLIEQLWALEDIPTENAIRAHIKGLRKKLKEVGVGDCIETVYGLGYRLKEAQIGKGAGYQENEKETESKESYSEQPTSNQPTHKEALSEISEFWEQYRAQYCERLCVIEQAISALHTKNLIEDLRQQAQREAHTLKGSLGLFGLERGSELSHEIEQLLKAVDNLNQEQKAHLAELTLSLRQVLEQPLSKTNSLVEVPNQHRCSQEAVLSRQWRLLIVDDDAVLAQQLAKTASDWNMEAELATNLAQARSLIAQKLPDIVLLDLTFSDLTEDGFGLLTELATYQPQLPVIVFTAQESFAERIKVARLGGKGFLHKPIAPTKVMEMIRTTLMQATAQILQPAYATDAQLLIVDDDAQLLNILRVLLQPWGFQVALLNDPQQFWSTLEEVKPDLLMLDIEMPEISGLDLCQVIRNDLRWGDLPILMLSAHTDDETIQRVFIAGADDYVSKPVRAAELVARVIRRLEHAKVLKKLRGLED
ncbi:response regulator [Microcoleus sp. T3_B1]|uniref:response regulator n=1 Tax=Microcoleus sp. T3_B1 TaxID=3055425 RepID=UPI002FD5777F